MRCVCCASQLISHPKTIPVVNVHHWKKDLFINRQDKPLFIPMSTFARKRLIRDFRKLESDPPAGVSGVPCGNDIMQWNALIFGPEDTPWEGGTFRLKLEFSEEYPNKPPKVRFITKMFHPNIYQDGQICLDILQNQWSPIYNVSAVLTSIQSLLCDPNPNSPANQEAAKLYVDDRREYNRKVKQIVEESWEDGLSDEENGTK
eukprot:Filipodium_phascolosomae@DN2137_c0_g1_i3.p1